MCRALLLSGALIAVACGGGGDKPAATATPEPTPTAQVVESGPGQVRASLEATCRVSQEKAELIVTYGARAEGGARLSRVRLLLNNQTVEDTGPLSQAEYRRVATLAVAPGGTYVYQVLAESPGLVGPSARSSITCPGRPTPTLGPRL